MQLGQHALLVVGYSDDAYFIFQNFYGVNWGYKGYSEHWFLDFMPLVVHVVPIIGKLRMVAHFAING